MNRLIATSVALAGMTGSALGADLGPPLEIPWTWAGPYVGVHAGFGWSNDESFVDCARKKKADKKKENGGKKIKTASAGPEGGSGTGVFIVDGKIVQSSEAEAGPEGAEATAESDGSDHGSSGGASEVTTRCQADGASHHRSVNEDSSGFMGGAQIGYNLQFSQFVVGVEGDISSTDWDGSRDVNWFATVRGRLGYAWDRVMPYATAGLAIAEVDRPFTGPSSETETGWTAGGGIEFAVSDNVSLRGEYLHFDLSDIDGDIVRGGINFRFWRPQPEPVPYGY
jgi:opacity protein-like surface antigen